MADTKISGLPDGTPAQAADQVPVNRSGTTDRVTAGTIAALGKTIDTSGTSAFSQVVVSGTAYYLTGSSLSVPNPAVNGIVVGTAFHWTIGLSKTAAGTGTFQLIIYRGTNGSTSDTADVTQTLGTQTAALDQMTVEVLVVVTTAGASGVYYWSMIPMQRAASAAGFGVTTGTAGVFSGTVSSVALNTAGLKFGLGFKSTTGTPTIAAPLIYGWASNLI